MGAILRKTLRSVEQVVTAVSSVMGVASAIVIALVALVVTYNVIQRLTFGNSILGIVDISALTLVVVAFGGIAQAERTETHVRMSILADRSTPMVRKAVLAISQLLVAALSVVMIRSTFDRAMASFGVNEVQAAQNLIPVWPIRFAIVAGLVALLAVCVVKFVGVFLPDDETQTENAEAGAQSDG